MIRLREEVVVDDAANLGTKTEEVWLWKRRVDEVLATEDYTFFGVLVFWC